MYDSRLQTIELYRSKSGWRPFICTIHTQKGFLYMLSQVSPLHALYQFLPKYYTNRKDFQQELQNHVFFFMACADHWVTRMKAFLAK